MRIVSIDKNAVEKGKTPNKKAYNSLRKFEERCRSGRTGRIRNAMSPTRDRGFESLLLRHIIE